VSARRATPISWRQSQAGLRLRALCGGALKQGESQRQDHLTTQRNATRRHRESVLHVCCTSPLLILPKHLAAQQTRDFNLVGDTGIEPVTPTVSRQTTALGRTLSNTTQHVETFWMLSLCLPMSPRAISCRVVLVDISLTSSGYPARYGIDPCTRRQGRRDPLRRPLPRPARQTALSRNLPTERQADRARQRAEALVESGKLGDLRRGRQSFRHYVETTWLPAQQIRPRPASVTPT